MRLAGVTGVLTAEGNLIRRRPSPEASGTAPVVILFTSGSSGDARAIALGEVGLLSVVDSHHAALGYPPGTRILGCLPWTHAFGFTLEFLMGLLKGAQLRSVPPHPSYRRSPSTDPRSSSPCREPCPRCRMPSCPL